MEPSTKMLQTEKTRLVGEHWNSKKVLASIPVNDYQSRQIAPRRSSFNNKIPMACKLASTQSTARKTGMNKYVLALCLLFLVFSVSLPAAAADETCELKAAVHTITMENCRPKRLLVPVCSGNCGSYTVTNPTEPATLTMMCTCCQNNEFRNVSVSISCNRMDGEVGLVNIVASVKVAKNCLCRPCDQTS